MQDENSTKDESISPELTFRLKRAVLLAGGAKRVAEETEFGLSTIYNYMKLKPEPPISFATALARLAKVRIEWLMLGTPPVAEDDDSGDWETQLTMPDHRRVPVFDVQASAGSGMTVLEEEPQTFWGFPKEYLFRLGQPDDLQMLQVQGDSMEPEIPSGNYVMIDRSKTRPSEGVFVVRLDDQIMIKRLRLIGGGRCELISANPLYPPVPIALDDPSFEIKGLVVWAGREMR